MDIKITKNLKKIKEQDRNAIDRLIEVNTKGKLDSYLKRYNKPSQEILLALTLEELASGKFAGTLRIQADADNFISDREDFKSLEDLVNHLFDHIKEQMAAAK